MIRDDIIQMAREADREWDCDRDMVEWLEWFAALVAAAERKRLEATAWGASKKWIVESVAAEREACAKVCEEQDTGQGLLHDRAVIECAAAIRARGETSSRGQV